MKPPNSRFNGWYWSFFLIYSTRTVWVATRTELRGGVMVSLNFVLTDEEAVHDGSNLQRSSATMILK